MRDETHKMKEYSQLNKELEVFTYQSLMLLIEYEPWELRKATKKGGIEGLQ
jgi:hypothetical protein